MELVWLTPLGALVGLAAGVPIAAWLLGEHRVRRVRDALSLRPPRSGTWWAPAALSATFALVAVAAAQPVLASKGTGASVRTAQVFVVLDTSTSMRAGSPSRYARAVAIAERVRDGLPGTPLGLASMTDRVLPHIFPSVDRDDFLATLHESMGIEHPPPARARQQASGFDALAAIGSARFFTNVTGRRVVLLVTDGESRSFSASAVARAFADARVEVVIVRVWRAGERIAGDPRYRADPASVVDLHTLANELHAPVLDESDPGRVVRTVQAALGAGERPLPPTATPSPRPLAPYAMVAALLPLGLLLWRRNVR